jgi:hypothetical protein
MSLNPGECAFIEFPYSTPPKTKICLCICVHASLFFVISTLPFKNAPADSQIKIFKEELGCLEYDSWLDVSKAYSLPLPEKITKKWMLQSSALQRITMAVRSQRYLAEAQKQLVLDNF